MKKASKTRKQKDHQPSTINSSLLGCVQYIPPPQLPSSYIIHPPKSIASTDIAMKYRKSDASLVSVKGTALSLLLSLSLIPSSHTYRYENYFPPQEEEYDPLKFDPE